MAAGQGDSMDYLDKKYLAEFIGTFALVARFNQFERIC
jgi:hypothetical protein